MQYRGYEIEIGDFSYFIYKDGKCFGCAVNESEAEEIIDELNKEKSDINKINWYDRFIHYCKELPGKFFIEDKLASYNITVLNKFKKSFEKATNTQVIIKNQYISGEYVYIVEEIIKET